LLELRLRHEADEGDIDPGTADRIRTANARLEDRHQHECEAGDWPSVYRIASRYNAIERWLETPALVYRLRRPDHSASAITQAAPIISIWAGITLIAKGRVPAAAENSILASALV
jgi:hypothetical protein